jgi:peptide/nickel transport system substrate-binding protein
MQMQELYAEGLPALPLIFRANPIVTRVGLVNFVSSTFNNGYGYPPTEPWRVGWATRGAEKVYDQADFGFSLDR